jgi:hypothetical protein
MGVALVVSGYRSISIRIGQVFNDRGMAFKDPYGCGSDSRYPYVNPQLQSLQTQQRIASSVPRPITGGVNWEQQKALDDKQVKSQVDAIYNSMSSVEDLPEAEAGL